MFSFIKKIKFINTSKANKSFSYQKTGINPRKDWITIVVSTSIILIISVLFSFYFYIQVENGTLFKTNYETPNVTSLNKQALDRVIKIMEEKQLLADLINSSKASLVDPAR